MGWVGSVESRVGSVVGQRWKADLRLKGKVGMSAFGLRVGREPAREPSGVAGRKPRRFQLCLLFLQGPAAAG